MPSQLTIEDIEDMLVRAGVVSPYIRQRILAKVKQYAMKYPVQDEKFEDVPMFIPSPPLAGGADPRYKYKCPACKSEKLIREFPERKRKNRRSPVPCTMCESLTGPAEAAILDE